MVAKARAVMPPERIDSRIYLIRGQKVMLSMHLAELYEVEVRSLVQAVKRNIDRFPEDFMFQLSAPEWTNLKSQIVISSWGGSRRARPYAFTEQGVAMLSSVLRSPRAVQVNIEVMRAFVRLRQLLATHEDLARKLDALEHRYDAQFKAVLRRHPPDDGAPRTSAPAHRIPHGARPADVAARAQRGPGFTKARWPTLVGPRRPRSAVSCHASAPGRLTSMAMASAALPPFVEALLRPQAYPHPAPDIRLLQTHISYVLLAGEYAYKIKKAVSLGFVDYTTLERRRRFCEEEVRLNRRLCDDVYLGVVPITSADGGYRLGGEGATIEYAVQMRRVPEERMLPQMLERGGVPEGLVRRIAQEIAAFHEREPIAEAGMPYGRVEGMRSVWRENFEQVGPYIGATIGAGEYEALQRYAERFLESDGAMLERRADEGHVRDGHGDMRADSIAIHEDGRICIMDCIEFSERLRYGDVASELGFLAMDLDFRGHADLADELCGAYLAATHDETLPLVLPFYRCYRAFVRGKVESLRSSEDEVPRDERRASSERARQYFDLAMKYTLPGSPALVLLCGLAGSGKSHVANALAARLGAALVASDVVRREMGATAYTEQARAAVYEEMHRRAAAYLRDGRSVVLDATYVARAQRLAARSAAAAHGTRSLVVHVTASPQAVTSHFQARAREPGAASEADFAVREAQSRVFEPPTECAPGEVIELDGARRASDNVAAVLERLDG